MFHNLQVWSVCLVFFFIQIRDKTKFRVYKSLNATKDEVLRVDVRGHR